MARALVWPLNPDGTCTVEVEAADAGEDFIQINGHTGLIGFSARPTERLRMSADAEFFSGDNTFFRITPRHLQDYRFRANYKANEWATLGAAVRILENRNTSLDIGNLQHNRSFGFSGAFARPQSIWGLDLSYDYNDVFSQTNICFVANTQSQSSRCDQLWIAIPFRPVGLYKHFALRLGNNRAEAIEAHHRGSRLCRYQHKRQYPDPQPDRADRALELQLPSAHGLSGNCDFREADLQVRMELLRL